MPDKTLTCKDCSASFVHSDKDQKFYAQKGFTDPKRCGPCRKKKRLVRQQEEKSAEGD